MSGAAAAHDALRLALQNAYKHVWQAGADFANTHAAALRQNDLVELMAASAHLVVAAAHLKDMAEAAEKELRSELSKQMQETGCTNVPAGNMLVYLQRKPSWVDIDQGEVPTEYMTKPEPQPDKRRIKQAIIDGIQVPGARLVIPNDLTLAIRGRNQ